MADLDPRKHGGGKLTRSETVTVRLDPKLRYLAELAAREQRRTLSSFIEWAVEDQLKRFTIEAGPTGQITFADAALELWDVDEADRFAKLALRYPHLLTHEEQVRWKLIREYGFFWDGEFGPAPEERYVWPVTEGALRLQRLRKHWDMVCAVARGTAAQDSLPYWAKSGRVPMTHEQSVDNTRTA